VNKLLLVLFLFFSFPLLAQEEIPNSAVQIQETSLYNARITQEGILMMGMHPSVDRRLAQRMADELQELGIRVVLSFHPLSDSFINELQERGIQVILQPGRNRNYWPFGSNGWQERIYEAALEHGINRISINCRWGVDRTGNAAAFLLATMGYLTVEQAWLSVVNHRSSDVENVESVLREMGYYPENARNYTGINRIGRAGMKTHTQGYIQYIRDTIRAVEEFREEDGC